MVRSRWAALTVLNLLLWVAFFAVMSSLAVADASVWLQVSFTAGIVALGLPLITLAPLLKEAPDEMALLMLLNSLIWGTFWDWMLRKFVDPPQDSRAEESVRA